MEFIYHIVTSPYWTDQLGQEEYRPASFNEEGFIHCCVPAQIAGVHERYYRDETDLLLLKINTALLHAPVRWETSASVEEDFPHIYGPLNRDAIAEVYPIHEYPQE